MCTMKKLMGTMLVFVLIITVFSACSSNKEQTASFDKNGKYVPEKQLNLTVWNTQGTDYVPKELDDNIVEDWLVEKTKVQVASIYGNDGGQWDPKLTKLVAGDNLPNIVHCSSGQGPAHFSKLDKLGKVWELTPEMIQKYAPEVWRRTPAQLWDRIKVNGKILGIPFNLRPNKETLPDLSDEQINFIQKTRITPVNDVMSQQTGYLYVRDDILKQFFPQAKSYDELSSILAQRGEPIGEELLDIPIFSTDEFVQFMYNIKKASLSADGKTVYAFGYSGGDNWEALSWLGADMNGYKSHKYTSTWNNVKEKIEIPLVGNMVKEAARIQNKMINDKIIDPESLAHTMTQFETKVLNGQYAICSASMLGDVVAINKQLEDAGKPFRYRPFITQVPAQPEYGAFDEEFLWNDSLCLLKTLKEDEVYQVLNWINVQFSDEYEEIVNWGTKEAGLYKETADGKREFTDSRFTDFYIKKNAKALQPEETKGLQGPATAGYKVGGLYGVMSTNGVGRWTPEIMQNYESYVPACHSGFKFLPTSPHVTSVKIYPPCQVWSSVYADIPEVVTFWAERGQWEEQFKMAIAAANGEFDTKWDEAVKFLNNIVNISEMERKMTEVAKPIAEKIKQNNSN